MNCLDYRANRLVDKLAALHAKPSVQARKGEKLVKDVKMAAKSALATLGRVTWAANNCKLIITDAEGNLAEKTSRDATGPPKKTKTVNVAENKNKHSKKEQEVKMFDE